MSKMLDTKDIIHITAEVIIIATISIYFVRRIDLLTHRVNELTEKLEKHEELINKLLKSQEKPKVIKTKNVKFDLPHNIPPQGFVQDSFNPFMNIPLSNFVMEMHAPKNFNHTESRIVEEVEEEQFEEEDIGEEDIEVKEEVNQNEEEIVKKPETITNQRKINKPLLKIVKEPVINEEDILDAEINEELKELEEDLE